MERAVLVVLQLRCLLIGCRPEKKQFCIVLCGSKHC